MPPQKERTRLISIASEVFCLQAAGVYLPLQIETQTFEMQSHAMSIRYSRVNESAFGALFGDIGNQIEDSGNKQSEIEDVTNPSPDTPQSADGQAGFMVTAMVSQHLLALSFSGVLQMLLFALC